MTSGFSRDSLRCSRRRAAGSCAGAARDGEERPWTHAAHRGRPSRICKESGPMPLSRPWNGPAACGTKPTLTEEEAAKYESTEQRRSVRRPAQRERGSRIAITPTTRLFFDRGTELRPCGRGERARR